MRYFLSTAILILFLNLSLSASVPFTYGSRSMALGFGGTAHAFDINSMFLNPALLSDIPLSMSGYQYQQAYFDYNELEDSLAESIEGIVNLSRLNSYEKKALFSKLGDIYNLNHGFRGTKNHTTGYVTKNSGMTVNKVYIGIVSPLKGSLNGKTGENLEESDLQNMKFRYTGLSYTKYSLAYSMYASSNISVGVNINYLRGKVRNSDFFLMSDSFSQDFKSRDYCQQAWTGLDEKFSKITADFGATMTVGPSLKLGIVYKNFGSPVLYGDDSDENRVVLDKRITAGLAFKPDYSWGIYIDIDIKKSDVMMDGNPVQPLSVGIEKGLFNNTFFLRGGIMNDLSEDSFFGKDSSIIYTTGLGFSINKIIIDFGIALDSKGSVRSLGISGYITI